MLEQNLIKTLELASLKEIKEGLVWYKSANNFAQELADKYNQPLDTVCKVISALSPATRWERNKQDAESMLRNYHRCGFIGVKHLTCATYGNNKRIAIDVLLGLRTQLQGLKTFNFYNNIKDPSNPSFVTIDRHAYAILVKGTDPDKTDASGAVALNKKNYLIAADIYKEVAKSKGILPCELQAITWLTHRNKLKG